LTLGELTESTRPISYGVLKPGVEDPDGVPLVRVCDITSNDFDPSQLLRIAPDLDEEFSRSRLDGGEILVSVQGTVGRVAICPQEYAGANISRTIALVAPDARVARRFVYWYLRWLGARDAFETVGTTRASLNIATLRKVPVPVPPLPEQRRIADILDKADAIRRKRKEAIALTEELLRSAFLEMFGDPVTNPKGWPERALGEVVELYAGNSLPPGVPFAGQTDGVLLLKVGDMNLPGNETEIATAREWAEEASSSAAVVPPGAVVIPKRGGAIATNKKRILRRSAALDPNLMAIAPGPLLQLEYLKQWFDALDLETLSNGSAVPQLNKKDLLPLRVQLPSVDVQSRFSLFTRGVARYRIRAESAVQNAEALFSALVHLAFRGELAGTKGAGSTQLGFLEGKVP
jgi:type I restriction enzyme S subunit